MASQVTITFSMDGNRYWVRGKTYEEAIERKYKKISELEKGRIDKDILLRDWIDKCIELYKVNLQENTLAKFKNRVKNCITKEIGHYKLSKITPLVCQQCINQQAGNSKYQINQTRQILIWLFEKAIDNNLMIKNPAKGCILPIGTVTERRALTDHERDLFLRVCEDDDYIVFLLSYYLGCRPAEAKELKYEDINGDYIHIRGTKTKLSDRVVPIPKALMVRIYNGTGYIALSEKGNKMDDKCYQRRWHSLIREMNILDGAEMYRNQLIDNRFTDLVPYNLRHDYCTRLAEKGIPLSTAKMLMGHSDIRLTSNIYQHCTGNILADALKLLNE